ncbi:MAG: hypothetical protein EOP51_22995, partial [Sphingobacteriales bacterium]
MAITRVLYLNSAAGTNNIGYSSGAIASFADWQAEGFDLQSSNDNPQFTNLAAGNLQPANAVIDNIGTPVGVLTDITGASRSTLIPDPGAYEFSVPVACPAPVGVTFTGITCVQATLNWIVTVTIGEFTIHYGPVGFTPGVDGTSFYSIFSAPFDLEFLTQGTTYQVYVQQDCYAAGMSTLSGPFTFTTETCVPGVISGPSSFCYSGTPTLELGSTGPGFTIQWQDSITGGTWTTIAGADSLTYTPSAPLTQTIYYRAITNGGSGNMISNVFEVAVSSPLITATNTPINLCAPGTAMVTATASTGDVKWYDAATDGNLLFTGTSFTTPVTSDTVFYAEASTGTPPTSHTTTFAGGNSSNGNIFPITALNSVTILSFAGNTGSTGNWSVYYRPDNYLNVPGANTSATGWILVGTASNVVPAGLGNPTPIPIPVNITIPAGMTYSFQVMSTSSVTYTNGTALGNVFNANSDFQFLEGHGGSLFNGINAPRVFNGIINYSSGCESPRVAVEVNLTPVTAINITGAGTICAGSNVTLSVAS